jgi:hypothetical protein
VHPDAAKYDFDMLVILKRLGGFVIFDTDRFYIGKPVNKNIYKSIAAAKTACTAIIRKKGSPYRGTLESKESAK